MTYNRKSGSKLRHFLHIQKKQTTFQPFVHIIQYSEKQNFNSKPNSKLFTKKNPERISKESRRISEQTAWLYRTKNINTTQYKRQKSVDYIIII